MSDELTPLAKAMNIYEKGTKMVARCHLVALVDEYLKIKKEKKKWQKLAEYRSKMITKIQYLATKNNNQEVMEFIDSIERPDLSDIK